MIPPQSTSNPDGTTTVRITRVRVALLETNKPQYMTAAAAKIHPHTLSLYAQGKRNINRYHLERLSEVLNLPPEEIVGWVSYVVDGNGEVVSQGDMGTKGHGDVGTTP
jgi:hypothetical protein